jgi:hypothetical protein
MVIKVLSILLLFLGTGPALTRSGLDCKQFKTGKFTLTERDKAGKYIVERDHSFQTETDVVKGVTIKFKVTWINDCTYQLNTIEGQDEAMNSYRGKTLTVRILETYTDGYKFEVRMEGSDYRLVEVLKRMK